jgi:hypothetical protein
MDELTQARRRKRWKERREFNKLLERSSLAYVRLFRFCRRCNKETATHPFRVNTCVECNRYYPKAPS